MRPRSLGSALLLFALSTLSRAATFDWTNAGSGTFSNAANWSPAGGPPGAADTARFALNANSNVTFSGNANVNAVTQNSGNVTFFLNGFSLQATAVNFSGMGADNATASLRILNGTFQPAGFTVGGNTGSNATLTLDASTVMTVNSGVFQVGNNGAGALIVQNGSQLTTNADTRLATNASGVGVATVNGAGSSWNIPNNPLRIGVNGEAVVNVLNGGTVTAHSLAVGEGLGANGTLHVSGADAAFTTNGAANIGGLSANTPADSATLAIGPGATVNLHGSTNFRTNSTLNVTGGALNLNTVSVAAGAEANWTAGTIAFANGSALTPEMLDYLLDGTHVLGANRTLSASVGLANLSAPLAVNGGAVNVNQLVVNAGLSIGAFGTVQATDALEIGSGQSVQIANFGQMGAGTLGHNNGGALILQGPNAQVTGFFANNFGVVEGTGRFTAGMNNGTGGTIRAKTGDHLIIEDPGLTNPGVIELAGGTVEYTHTLSNLGNGFITGRGVFRGGTASPGGNGLSNIGTMAFSAGATDIHGDVNNSGGGLIVAAGGSVVTFYDDVTHNGAEIRTNAGSRTVFFGNLSGAGPLTGGGAVEFNGDLRPGNSPALLTLGGDAEFSVTSAIEIEIAGTEKGLRYDSLDVASQATLHGDLNVTLIDGFSPVKGDAFEILTAGSILGSFDDINLPALPGLLFWEVQTGANSISLVVDAPVIPGDFNLDGFVDGADLAQWEGDYGDNGDSDADEDGDSDGGDFLVWQRHFGQSIYGSLTATTSVPEPSSAVLLVCCAGLVAHRDRAKL